MCLTDNATKDGDKPDWARQALRDVQMFVRSLWHSVFAPALDEVSQELSQSQLACLRFVEGYPGCAAGELSRALQITPAAATKLVDRLVVKGLIRRGVSDEDRRVVLLQLTDEGRQLLQRVTEAEAERLQRIFHQMPASSRDELFRLLRLAVKAAAASQGDISGICLQCGRNRFCGCVLAELCPWKDTSIIPERNRKD